MEGIQVCKKRKIRRPNNIHSEFHRYCGGFFCRSAIVVIVFMVVFTMVDSLAEARFMHKRTARTVFSPKRVSTLRKIDSEEKAATNKTRQAIRPRLNLSRHTIIPFDPFAFRCTTADTTEVCANRTDRFANNVLAEFRRSLRNAMPSSMTDTDHQTQPSHHPVCQVLGAKVRTLRHSDLMSYGEYNRLAARLPRLRLLHGVLSAKARGKRTCAIVASAGSLSRSGLGAFIDQHDIVMRFNHAPVDGYTNDVGRKTTIRVVNSQVVTKPEFDFVRSPMFRNISVAAWDPGRFNGTLSEWLAKPDFNLFENYIKYRQNTLDASDAHLIDPRSIWNLWTALQQFTVQPVQANPPSSGFIGLALLLPVCAYVDLIEYVPSTRLNGRCHYYDDDVNPACTFGSWHPLAAEKLMAYAMNTADAVTTFQRGIVRVRRPRKTEC